jgi:lysophospholipase L1-like esterase
MAGVIAPTTPPIAREVVQLESGPFLSLDLRNDERQSDVVGLRMLYRAAPEPLELALSINNGPERRVHLDAATLPGAAQALFLGSGGGNTVSTLMIRIVAGEFALLGFALERETAAALTIDTLAFPGATVKGWAQINPERLAALMRGAPYDALMLEYGTNEAAGDFDASRYAETLHQALIKLRGVFPGVPCLLLGPPDRGSGERPLPASRVGRASRVDRADRASRADRSLLMRHALIHKQVNAIQARVGARHGCRSWDWQHAMGGVGSAYRWARTSPPRMARDLIHLTSEGYRQSAALLASKIGWGVVGDARRISAGCVAGQVGAGDPDSRSDCLSAVHRTVVGDGGI